MISESDKILLILKWSLELFEHSISTNQGRDSENSIGDALYIEFQKIYLQYKGKYPENLLEHLIVIPQTSVFFMLNQHGMILDYNHSILDVWQYKEEELNNQSIQKIIDKKSYEELILQWNTQPKEMCTNILPINFITKNNLRISLYCHLIFLAKSNVNLLIGLDFHLINSLQMNQTQNKENHFKDTINAIALEIIEHLSEPLIPIKTMSWKHAISEENIKIGFKQWHQCTYFQFYQNQRLHKAFQLIQEVDLSLKVIAIQCGFDDYINFYKAFRKKYGFPPSLLYRHKNFTK